MISTTIYNYGNQPARGIRIPLTQPNDLRSDDIKATWLALPDLAIISVETDQIIVAWPQERVMSGAFMRLEFDTNLSTMSSFDRPEWLYDGAPELARIRTADGITASEWASPLIASPPPADATVPPPSNPTIIDLTGAPSSYLESDIYRLQLYFRDIETNTSDSQFSSLIPKEEAISRRDALNRLIILFRDKLRERLNRPIAARDPANDWADAMHFSSLLKKISFRHFGSTTDPSWFDWTDFDRAFERFANGHLNDIDSRTINCEPDGYRYFFFAEFARFCIDQKVDVAFWNRALPTFVRTQVVFAKSYRIPDPRTKLIHFMSYGASRYVGVGAGHDVTRELRRIYENTNLSDLDRKMTENTKGAFRDQP